MTMTAPRWITFDPQTAHHLRSRGAAEIVSEVPGGNALKYALGNSASLVAVLKTGVNDQCALAVFRPARPRPENTAGKPRMVASGILGLGDETVFEDEEQDRPKSWWRRLWED